MKNPLKFAVAIVLCCCASLPARADQAAPAAGPPADVKPAASPAPVVNEVVVTGERPAVERKVDRTIYNLSRELQATSGSAADVLGNLPSVSVDIDGNPSLRGDDSVQILVDGRDAPQFNGANRGAALQQLGAENIDRIEIITNPPANFKRDGSAGIINIVTKRRTGTRSATALASVGSGGRYNASTSQGMEIGKLSLNGSLGARHDFRTRDIESRRIVRDPSTGSVLTSREFEGAGEDDRLSKSVTLGADLDLSTEDRLSAEGNFYRRDADTFFDESNLVRDNEGVATRQFDRRRVSREHEYNSSALLRYHHDGEADGDGLTFTAERSEYSSLIPQRLTSTFLLPPDPPAFQRQVFDEHELVDHLAVEYVSTLANDSKVISGYDFENANDEYDYSLTVPSPIGTIGAPDPAFTNLLRIDHEVQALYGSYEHPFGRWTALAGLRLEETDLGVHQVATAERSGQHFFRVYPTLHLSEKLSEQQTLIFSYGRRVVRAFGQDLNPYRVQLDSFTIHGGNPRLEPSEIDSLEAGWSYDEGHTALSTTLYARHRSNEVNYISTPISQTVVLTTPQNVGESLAGGLEISASGRWAPQLDYQLSGNVYYNEIDASNLGFGANRTAYAYEAKAAVNWRVTAKDKLQVNLSSSGKRLTAQGYRRGFTTVDLGFRHQFQPNFSITATVSDVFAKRGFDVVLDSPTLSDSTHIRLRGRIAWLGVTWSLPSAKQDPQDNFEYGE